MNTKEWIASLKVGDEVGMSRYSTIWIGHVEEVNLDKRKRAKVKVDRCWFDENGYQTPRVRWSSLLIVRLTDEHREKLRREALVNHIHDAPLATYSTERLERIAAIVDEVKP